MTVCLSAPEADGYVLARDLGIQTMLSVDQSQPLLLVQYMYSSGGLSSPISRIGPLSAGSPRVEMDIGYPADTALGSSSDDTA